MVIDLSHDKMLRLLKSGHSPLDGIRFIYAESTTLLFATVSLNASNGQKLAMKPRAVATLRTISNNDSYRLPSFKAKSVNWIASSQEMPEMSLGDETMA